MATESMQGTHAASDYESAGGGPAIRVVVDRLYELVLADDRLSGYFVGADIGQVKRHQELLVSQVMGGPARYAGRDLRRAHAGLAIRGDDFSLVVSYLAAALEGVGVPPEVILRVCAEFAAAKPDVVGVAARA